MCWALPPPCLPYPYANLPQGLQPSTCPAWLVLGGGLMLGLRSPHTTPRTACTEPGLLEERQEKGWGYSPDLHTGGRG